MPRKRKNLCITPECDNEVHCLDMCMNCYQRARYWKNKSMKQMVGRVRKLHLWGAHMEMMLGNVRPIKRTRKKAASR